MNILIIGTAHVYSYSYSSLIFNVFSETPQKRRTLRDVKKRDRTPKAKRSLSKACEGTPSKKIESLVSTMWKKEVITSEISELRRKICEQIHLLPLNSNEDTIRVLSLYFTPPQLAILSSAINHVPANFLNSTMLILNICMASPFFKDIPPATLNHVIPVLKNCENYIQFWRENPQDISGILWQASKDWKEPYLKFVNPPVQQCVECGETLYPYSRICVTFYSLGGPIPGQRGISKCKKCRIYYHLTGYVVPNRGKMFYVEPITCDWKCASNKVFFDKDLHEFMCESRYIASCMSPLLTYHIYVSQTCFTLFLSIRDNWKILKSQSFSYK